MKTLWEKLLTPDMAKVIYRGNFTKSQAALYFGIGELKLQKRIDSGELAVNFQDGNERISRIACDNYLRKNEYIAKRK
ncbi:MAG: hypothetical protein A2499_02865 [Stygiobacter sp. RIFOXYC12_FULL_38_8]|nr:MAG: hypothetical protein A2299_02045 [Stygiobacter sp. RIFOXYB2_FULL_37_11]OGV15126.1 MAG: hypothetical protein A2440_07205 [Stygiobacter sp. RIFOXYC2_FULL_38_25]OGV17061.1 MAG: hypothetical protein A2237_18350 [Stygiobacter sp. RIFOXYA2_FULL_38_8]OGV27317.1 MAG: hypothetical protein A2499_02865 [Stygiobacter sp. RIFOXYC12_FULL_38_8]OGV79701.1 MAG: hypothetical protein A2X65_19290 [Stygiobacter sp. GWF2_38_21]